MSRHEQPRAASKSDPNPKENTMAGQTQIQADTITTMAKPRSPGIAKVFVILATVLAVDVVAQLFFAGYAVFTAPATVDRAEWGLHAWNGRVVLPLLAILTGLAAVWAKAPKRLVGFAFLPLAGIAFQTVLFILTGLLTGSTPEKTNVAGSLMLGLHPMNGVLVLALTMMLVHKSRQFARGHYPLLPKKQAR